MNDNAVKNARTAAVVQLLERFSAGWFVDAMELFVDDAEVDLPFQDERTGFWSHVSGKRDIHRLFVGTAKLFDRHSLTLDEAFYAADKDSLIARYHGDFIVRGSGKPYRNTYVAIFRFQVDKICSWTEFFNPHVLAESLRD